MQADAYKMGFTQTLNDSLENNHSPDPKLIKALAALSSLYEPARELIVVRLKNVLIIKLLEQETCFELFHSLSRGSKILKNILVEEQLIMQKLRLRMTTNETALKVVSNLSIDRKIFIENL